MQVESEREWRCRGVVVAIERLLFEGRSIRSFRATLLSLTQERPVAQLNAAPSAVEQRRANEQSPGKSMGGGGCRGLSRHPLSFQLA